MAKSHRVGRDKQELSNAQKGRFVGAGSNRSHAAWTEFMPVRVAKAFANEWVKIHFHTQ